MGERVVKITINADSVRASAGISATRAAVRGLGDEAAETTRRYSRAGSEIERMNDRIARSMGIAMGAGIAAFTALAKHQLDAADAAGKLAERLGVSTEFLTAMGFAAKSNGSSVQSFNAAMLQLVDNLGKAAANVKEKAVVFQALGVSVRDAAGHLRTAEQVLPEIAAKISALRDATDRAAASQDVFGSHGVELTQTLKQLAEQGLAKVTEQAAQMGQVIGKDAAEQAAKLNDQIDALKNSATGVTNEFLRQVLPALNGYIDAAATAGGKSTALTETATVMANAFKGVALVIVGVKNLVEGLVSAIAGTADAVGAFITGVDHAAAGVDARLNSVQLWMQGQWSLSKLAAQEARQEFDEAAKTAIRMGSAWQTGMDGAKESWNDAKAAYQSLFGQSEKTSAAFDLLADAWKAGKGALSALTGEVGKATDGDKSYTAAKGALLRTEKQHHDAVRKVTDAEREYLDVQRQVDDALRDVAQITQSTDEHIAQQRDRMAGLDDVQVRYNSDLREMNRLTNEALALGPPTVAQQQAIENGFKRIADARDIDRAAENQRRYADQVRETAQRVRGYYESMADALANALTRGGNILKNLGRALVDTLRQIVTDMIAQWLRTRIIGTFLGSGSIASGAMAYAGSAAAGEAFGGPGGVGGLSLLSPTSWVSAGKSLWQGFSSGNGGAFQFFGRGFESSPGFVGPPTSMMGSGPWGGTLGGFSTVGLAGAGIGLSYGLSRGDGGVGTALSGAAGATAGYAVGAAAATAISSGVAAGLAAVPVVGWIALAALLVDKISGGKLFGTKYRPESATQTLSIGEGGGSASLSLYETRQKAFFGGKQSRTKSQDPGDDARKAAEEFFAAIQQTMTSAAKALAVEVPPVIDASIRTVTEYDKKGKVKATKILVDAIGRTWEEATAELAQQRINAEAIIATVDKSAADASGIAEQWRGSAEKLFQGAQLLLAAQVDIKNGAALLGATATLGDTVKVVSDLAQSGEALLDTYARLVKETKAVQDAFALAGATLQKTGVDLVKFADDIASAAGGGDAAQQLWQRFFTAFYSEAELAQRQVDQLRPRLTTDLTALGLGEDTTQAQFRAAFEAALPKLSPDEVVKWLRAADELATFYELSAKAGGAAQDAVRSYAGMVADLDNQLATLAGGGITDFQKALGEIAAAQKNTVAQLNAAARAAGLQGAREEDLSKVHQIAAARAAAAARQLEAQSRDLVQRLYGGGADTLTSAAQSASSALGSVATGLGGVADAASRFRDSMLLDSQLSPLNAQQQLQEAMKQLRATGDEGTARRALEIARGLTASGDDYRQLFDQITALVRPQAASGGGPRGGGYDASASAQQTLSPAERADLAQQLARNVADLSGFGDKSYADVAKGLGLDLGKLGQDLGLQGQALTDYLDSLKADSYSLDDVDGVITRQVDRIVSAILRGQDVTGSPDTSAVATSPKGTPETVPPPPSGGLPASASQTATNDKLDAIGGKLEKVSAGIDNVVQAVLAVARVSAGTGEDTVAALREVEMAVADVRREIGSGYSTGNVRTMTP